VHDIAHLVSVIVGIEVILILVRVLLSWFPGIDPWNPLVRALRSVVDPVLYPFRQLLPSFSGIDLSPILAIVVLDQVRNALDLYAANLGISATYFVVDVFRALVLDIILVFIVITALRVIISMFHADPFHPMVRLVRDVSSPVVRPFASVLPRSRAIDVPALLALAVFIVAYIVAADIFDALLRRL
jgi:YggT family protein